MSSQITFFNRAKGSAKNAVLAASIAIAHSPVFAVGAGTVTATQTRITNVTTDFNAIMLGVGTAILTAAFAFVGYSMAFGGKKWSDVANVAYGSAIAGVGGLAVGWLYS